MIEIDADRVAAAQRGDKRAMADLVRQARPRLFLEAFRRLGNRDDAQDVVSAAILQLCKKISTLRNPALFGAWLHRVLRNEINQFVRARGVSCPLLPDGEPISESTAWLRSTRFEERSLDALSLQTALGLLTPRQALAFTLFHINEMPLAQVAAAMNTTVGTTGSLVSRARIELKKHLQENQDMPKESAATPAAPSGWWIAGSNPRDYAAGLDREIVLTGAASAFLKSNVRSPKGFGALMQMFQAKRYRGKRLRIIGVIKAKNIERRSGLWMRVDGRRGVVMAFDNMVNRAIRGTQDWAEYPIVLDVPDDAVHIAIGLILEGKGQLWLDHVSLEMVGTDVALTADEEARYPEEAQNLDFETVEAAVAD